jgi:RNA polymerase sigma factor (TIGR02999 family)
MEPPSPPPTVTELLVAWRDGSDDALGELMERVYPELRRIAARHFRRERSGHTLQPTEVVHEAWMRLAGGVEVAWRDRGHFYAIASRVMRRILVEHARAAGAHKRRRLSVSLHEEHAVDSGLSLDVLALDAALTRLKEKAPFETDVVQLRFFGGLSIAETAAELGCGHDKVERSWAFAKAWLFRELARSPT